MIINHKINFAAQNDKSVHNKNWNHHEIWSFNAYIISYKLCEFTVML